MDAAPFEPTRPPQKRRRFRQIPVRTLVPNLITLLALCFGLTAIRLAIEAPFVLRGNQIYTSVSIGVASFPRQGQDLETVARNADKALYLSKSEGRNRVTVYAEP